jgi:glycine oxidase
MLTARELVSSGAEISLVEMGETGRESSWAGGGIISPLYPWRYADSVTALSLWSQKAYPQLCADLQEETGIDPELIRTGLLTLDGDEQTRALPWSETHDTEVEILRSDAVEETEPGLGLQPASALWMPQIAQVRNPRLARSLRRSIETHVQIREQEEVVELLVGSDRVIGARTRKETIEAKRIIVCTGAWTANLLEKLGNKPDIEPIRGQMILFYAKPGQINHIVLYRDRYVIPRKDGRVLVGSTLEHEGFVKTTTAEAKEDLYRAAVEIFPLLKSTPIENHWAGLRPGAPSGIPYIGTYPGIEGLYFNAGHFRNGLVTGPASARLAADLVLARTPTFDPAPYALDASR